MATLTSPSPKHLPKVPKWLVALDALATVLIVLALIGIFTNDPASYIPMFQDVRLPVLFMIIGCTLYAFALPRWRRLIREWRGGHLDDQDD